MSHDEAHPPPNMTPAEWMAQHRIASHYRGLKAIQERLAREAGVEVPKEPDAKPK